MGLYIPYISIQDNDIRKKISEMDVSYDPYRFLYDTCGGERKKFHSFIMIARQFTDEFYENEIEMNVQDINGEYEIIINGTNELVKIFNQK